MSTKQSSNYFVITQDQKSMLINSSGETIIPLDVHTIEILDNENGLFKVHFGYELTYEKMDNAEQGINAICWTEFYKTGGHFELYNNEGKKISPIKFNYIDKFEEGMAIVNIEGNYYSTTTYDYKEKEDEYINGGKFGIINESGKLLLDIIYDSIIGFNIRSKSDSKKYLVQKDTKYFLIVFYSEDDMPDNESPYYVYSEYYEHAEEYSFHGAHAPEIFRRVIKYYSKLSQFISVFKNGKSGLFDPNGNLVLKVNYDFIIYIPGTLCFIAYNGELNLFSITGEQLSEIPFIDFRILYRGGASYRDAFYSNDSYDEQVESRYFEDYWFPVKQKPHINENVIGLKLLTHRGWMFFDIRNGRMLKGFFQGIFLMHGEFLLVKDNEKYGVINFDAEVVLNCQYDEIVIKSPKRFRVRKDDMVGEVNERDVVIQPFDIDACIDGDPEVLTFYFCESYSGYGSKYYLIYEKTSVLLDCIVGFIQGYKTCESPNKTRTQFKEENIVPGDIVEIEDDDRFLHVTAVRYLKSQ